MKDSSDLSLKMFFGYRLTDTDDPLYSHLLRWHNTGRIKSFFSDELLNSLNGSNPLEDVYRTLPNDFSTWSDLSQSQFLETTLFMSGYLLSSQGDRMAMGNSVEGRYPFLDYRLVEFANRLPDHFKLNGLNEKFILKRLSKGKIPESISNRSKQAYRAPIAGSLFSPHTPEYLSEMVSETAIRDFGIFNPQKVKTLLANLHRQQQVSETDQMAAAGILSTQLLAQMFIHNPVTPDTGILKKYRLIDASKK
jgi:asparagine synthase (glutamine-hydrolysing)